MKIIHCSDLHLDSKMETNLNKTKARERNQEVFLTFKRLISYARDNDVRVIMIAGDMFDEKRVSSTTVEMVTNAIAEAEEIDFFYLRGNHDETSQPLRRLKNLKCFGKDWTYYEYENIRFAGLELDKDNFASCYGNLVTDENMVNIVMLHGQESSQVGEELICLNGLKGKNIRYLALGHLHSYKKELLDSDGIYCYCGCLEGRGFDECGEKGFVLLDVKGNIIETEFVPFAKRKLHEIRTDISGFLTINEIVKAIESDTESIAEQDLVKVTLCGSYLPDTNKDLEFIKKVFENRFYFIKIKDESRLFIEAKDYQYDKSLKGEFVRTVLASDKSEAEKEKIICCGLAALKKERLSL